MITLGVDIGNLLSKAVVLNGDDLAAGHVVETTGNIAGEIGGLVAAAMSQAGIAFEDIDGFAGTGSGSEMLESELLASSLPRRLDFVEDEVTCVGAAAGYLMGDVDVVVDIGGQSITTILLDEDGEVVNFMRNDKCASGSGRFLEVMSRAVGIPIDDIDVAVVGAKKPVLISSQCGVFAESEVISYVNAGEEAADIVAGLCDAVASIVVAQARKFSTTSNYTLTGGVARIEAVARIITEKLEGTYHPFPYDPRLAAAVGAALLAGEE